MPGWLGTVTVTCATVPSLILGSRGRDTMPFWLAVTTLATTLRSFHITFPWPCPSVINTLPSGSVTTTTTGDFSPGAIPGPFGRLTWMDEMGVLSRYLPSQLDLQGRAPTQRKQGGHREAGRPACAHGIWNVDFDKKPNQSTATQGSVVTPVRTQHHSAIPFGEEFLSLAAFTSEASHSASSAGRFASTAKLIEAEPLTPPREEGTLGNRRNAVEARSWEIKHHLLDLSVRGRVTVHPANYGRTRVQKSPSRSWFCCCSRFQSLIHEKKTNTSGSSATCT